MDINAEELMRRYELLDQEPVLEYYSLETEADNENPLSTLSTPSTITDTRVPTFTGKPGKMRVHLENLEKSWNFAKNNKNHGKITWNLEKYLGRL